MRKFFDDVSAEEYKETVAKLHTAAEVLTAAAADIKRLAASNDDVENISNDAFRRLIEMLAALRGDYDIAVMCEDAAEYTDED